MAKKRKQKFSPTGRILANEWNELVQRHHSWPPFKRVATIPPKPLAVTADLSEIEKRVATFVPHGGTAKPSQVYTGTKMIGVGAMHKSNLVPVFSAEEAEDMAKMRRG